MNTAAKEPKRDRWGRYLLPDPLTGEERPWTRATTISGLLDDKWNLEQWGNRMVVLGLLKRPDLIVRAKAVRDPFGYSGKRTLNGIVKDAKSAAGSESRANIGTAIHAFTEAVDRGEVVDVPAPYDRDVEVYSETMDRLGIEVVPGWIERIVVNTALGIAGTLDRMVQVPGWDLPCIADVKTGATVHFSEMQHAIQQAIYAYSSHVWDPDAEMLEEMPVQVDRKRALIVHLPAGEAKCDVHVLDIESGWHWANVALQVHASRKVKGMSAPFDGAER